MDIPVGPTRKRRRTRKSALRRLLVPVVNDHMEEAWNDTVRAVLALPGWLFKGVQPHTRREGIYEATAHGNDPWTHTNTGRQGRGYTPGAALRSLTHQLVLMSVPIDPHPVLVVEMRDIERCKTCSREVIKSGFTYIHTAKRLNPIDRQDSATEH